MLISDDMFMPGKVLFSSQINKKTQNVHIPHAKYSLLTFVKAIIWLNLKLNTIPAGLEQRRPGAEWCIVVLSLQTVLQGPGPIHYLLPGVEESLGAAENLPAAAVSTHDRIPQRCWLQEFKLCGQLNSDELSFKILKLKSFYVKKKTYLALMPQSKKVRQKYYQIKPTPV